jgi:hypothetical protein
VLQRLLRRVRGNAHPITDAWVDRRLDSTRLYTTLSTERIVALRLAFPRQTAGTVGSADRYVRHEFDLLGSGPFVPIDPDRPSRDGYTPIDWYLDPVRQLRFPRGVPHKQWKLYEMRPGNSDVKYPWELARCQHWAALGQAFLLTGDDRYAREIAGQLDDFVNANPVGIGINFTCTMDVAIRAVNWAVGLELVHRSSALDAAFWRRAYTALYDTGVFTRDNLENHYEVTSNHYLSNVVGLWFLGAVFADLPNGQEWLSFARTALEQEQQVQVLPDGADYESSVPYHRLVTELFLASLRLADFRGEPLSAQYRTRVRDMVTFLHDVVRPDGLMPQCGDADDGRLHVMSMYERTTPQDPRHLIGAAGAVFDQPEWLARGGELGRWERAWWGLAWDEATAGSPQDASRLFPDAGLAVLRAGSHYLLVSNGIVGTKGFGNHKHNDLLSFEYHHDGVPLVVDPGSYVYTSDFDARNLFRSTSSHNTLQIDGEEQNELKPEWIFRLFETSNAEHVAFNDTPQCLEYTGRHHGYERFDRPVTHERTLRLSKADGTLTIVDRLTGLGEHGVRWHFHLAPGVEADATGPDTVRLSARGLTWTLRAPADVSLSIGDGAYSPSYGVKLFCRVINLRARVAFDDDDRVWSFSITP